MRNLCKLLFITSLSISLCACTETSDEPTITTSINEEYEEVEETYSYQKSDLDKDKVETVYVNSNAYGEVEKIEVETTLKAKETGNTEDIHALENVINTSGDENYEIQDNKLIFENHGNDITYKGSTNKELPVGVHFTYYLNDKEIKVEDLAHQSGHLKINVEYTNNTPLTNNVQVPFVCITLFMLNPDKFSNVTLDNGKLINASDYKIAVLYAEPGLKESLALYKVDTFDDIKLTSTATIEADVTDFALDYTSTLVSNGLFDEVKDSNINDLSSSINDLSELNTKIDDIKDATNQLKDKGDELVDGVCKLKDAITTLDDGIQTYNSAISNISTLTSSLATLASSLNAVATNDLLKGVTTSVETTSQILDVMLSYTETIRALKETADQINLEDLSELDDENTTKIAITTLKESLDCFDDTKLSELKDTLTSLKEMLNSEEFTTGYATLVASANKLNEACSSLNSNDSVNKLTKGMQAIADGSSTLKDVIVELDGNMPKLKDAINEFSNKINEAIDDSRDDLNKYSGTNMKNIISNIKNLKTVDQNYDTFVGKLDGTTSSVSFIIETDAIK